MHDVDPGRIDLVEEFDRNPFGPHGPELTLLVNRLRLMPLEERFVIVCTRRGREWAVARMPASRDDRLTFVPGGVFDDYADAVREVFRLRWRAVTGREPAGAGHGGVAS